jgi:glycosyltransferase involved in cell wall biosynthesis
MPPVLSVIIPAYNVEDYIVRAIQSALNQTLRELEVIVIDDGSTDSTPVRIASIQDPRLTVITQENAGLSAARNAGILESRGKYIGLLDGDDIWFPEKAELHLSLMEQDSSLGITFSYLAYVDEKGKFTGQILITKAKEPTLRDMIVRNHITPSTAIIRKDCFLQAGLFDETLRALEDHEMWVRILHRTYYKARLIPKVLTGYLERSGSLTGNFDLFLHNAHIVMEKFKTTMPEVTKNLKNRALAGAYRIASRKALSAGQLDVSSKLMKDALRHCPTIIFRDLRAFGTFLLIILERSMPTRWRQLPYQLVRWMMKVFYRNYIK